MTMKCPNCGADPARLSENERCENCGFPVRSPNVKMNAKQTKMLDDANVARQRADFEEAEGKYEQLIAEGIRDDQVFFAMALAKARICFVTLDDDENSKRYPIYHGSRIPGKHFTTESYYKSAIELASEEDKESYKEIAERIDRIQRNIINGVKDKYEIFICNKTTDHGRPTNDAQTAKSIYNKLEKGGFKGRVFWAQKTLGESFMAEDYEAAIYCALFSSSIMIVISSKTEYLTSPWVKSEWSRYKFIHGDAKGKEATIVPMFAKGVALPDGLDYLEGLNIRQEDVVVDFCRKMLNVDNPQSDIEKIKNVWCYLRTDQSTKAKELCLEMLERYPDDAEWNLVHLLAKNRCKTISDLREHPSILNDSQLVFIREKLSGKMWTELEKVIADIEEEKGDGAKKKKWKQQWEQWLKQLKKTVPRIMVGIPAGCAVVAAVFLIPWSSVANTGADVGKSIWNTITEIFDPDYSREDFADEAFYNAVVRKNLKNLSQVKRLNLSDADVSDLSDIRKMPELKTLTLASDCTVQDFTPLAFTKVSSVTIGTVEHSLDDLVYQDWNAPKTPCGTGDADDEVKKIQTRLKDLGYYQGSIDGHYGTGTRSAVVDFASKNAIHGNMNSIGYCSNATCDLLFGSAALPASAGPRERSEPDLYGVLKTPEILSKGRIDKNGNCSFTIKNPAEKSFSRIMIRLWAEDMNEGEDQIVDWQVYQYVPAGGSADYDCQFYFIPGTAQRLYFLMEEVQFNDGEVIVLNDVQDLRRSDYYLDIK